jgi:hypothetical protein
VSMSLQMWDMRTQKLREDLPGHADEVQKLQCTVCIEFCDN